MPDLLHAGASAPMREHLERAETARGRLRERRGDRWYPRFHIAAPAGWINDPNGLSYYRGRYQVYFQHNPFAAEHDSMHWGHVSSSDLVTWRHDPIALAPSTEEDRDGVYSGSAVVSDDGELVVFFTGNRWCNGADDADGNLQVQCMAVSRDGIAFEKRGVVVDRPEGIAHFRDPKVWRTDGVWHMILGVCSADDRGEVWLYTSRDMRDWEFDRVLFRDPDPAAFMLECPDLFPLPTSEGDKWVLLYCPMGTKPSGYLARNGHNAGYVVGDWAPGRDFEQLTDYLPLDWGGQYYAPQTFEAPDGRRIAFAWMGSFTAPLASEEDGWSGQLTVPRVLSLGDDLRLRSRPVEELAGLRTESLELGSFELAAEEDRVLLERVDAAEVELELDLAASAAERVGLAVNKTPGGHETLVAYDDLARRVILDRRRAGHGDRGYRSAPCSGDRLTLRVLVDRASVEVFVNDGAEAITSFAFPAEGPRSIELYAESGSARVTRLAVHRIVSIWEGER
ncbi:glycoside hydrolase family 32 protein [Leucobacter sp. CSA1]|uniref:Sucrose-6-phosphate hydrolase n=1 Tax=Leucobacter chromiisoli TaxID=2796471 RepID=A0A934Q8D8_9MICO|nr:glycoside hydrolase family 32 protein [Leucobacter chromiisoli]MBK0419353.1 glycoside hydrolase family 32 protein [Leucobacter chromiisoli]